MSVNSFLICVALSVGFIATGTRYSQQSRPSRDSNQDVLKTPIEEVRIPIFALDARGRFDTQLSVSDLLIREDGVAQTIRGVYRVPAFVVLLIDTGGESNLLKTVRLSADVAVEFISKLRLDDAVSVMQVNSKVEVISDWSNTRPETIHAIHTKLLPGKYSRLAEGVDQAVESLQKVPAGNRHLVIISDGLDGGGRRLKLDETMRETTSSGIAVHVISYTSLTGKVRKAPISRPREKSSVPQELIQSWPYTHDPRDPKTYDMKDIVQAKGGVTVDVDRLFRRSGTIKKEMAQRELEFGELAEETGGVAWLPETVNQMIIDAGEAALDIDSQYVVTYKPQRPLVEAKSGEYRKLDVISRRVGLHVRSKRGFLVVASSL